MFSTRWETSKRKYGVKHDKNVAIPVRAGFTLDCDVLRPDSPYERFPCIICPFPFDKEVQFKPTMPVAICPELVSAEGGDPNFYARRGYAQVFINLRGTGKSGGTFDHMGPGTIEDLYDAIEWLAKQPWCDGQVATFGTSYFAMTAKHVAALKPPSLKTIFAPFGVTDQYRDAVFHGGIFSFKFHKYWLKSLSNLRVNKSWRDEIGRAEWDRRVKEVLKDPEIAIQQELVDVLNNPDEGGNIMIAEYLLSYLDNEVHKRRLIPFRHDVKIPGYFGGCWGMHMLHLPGDLRTYENWAGPKKLTIGPPYYLDRPVYQYQDESLRWFDYWMKGINTEIMDEPPVSLFIMNTGEWKNASEWPLRETKWTEFYLHNNGLLFEHEMFPDDSYTTFTESPKEHGAAEFKTPLFVEKTEIVGNPVLNFYASTTDTEALFFVSVFEEKADGSQKIVSRGWLRGSQRRLDAEKSKPWLPYHPHDKREPLKPNEVYEFNVAIMAMGIEMQPGSRLGIRIKGTDRDEHATDFVDNHAYGHLWRETDAKITVHHSNQYPSALLLPITKGNKLNMFISGGVMPPLKGGH